MVPKLSTLRRMDGHSFPLIIVSSAKFLAGDVPLTPNRWSRSLFRERWTPLMRYIEIIAELQSAVAVPRVRHVVTGSSDLSVSLSVFFSSSVSIKVRVIYMPRLPITWRGSLFLFFYSTFFKSSPTLKKSLVLSSSGSTLHIHTYSYMGALNISAAFAANREELSRYKGPPI